MDSLKINRLIDKINSDDINVFSICVNGKTTDLQKNVEKSNLYSLSKNITSLAIGILIDRGLIELDASFGQLFQGEYPELADSYNNVTIYDLLTQTSGIEKGFLDVDKDDKAEFTSDDYLKIVFTRGVKYPPGQKFVYSDSNYYCLSRVISLISGVKADQFIIDNIFRKCGIEDYSFQKDPRGHFMGATGIYLTSAEENIIGQIYLNKGSYKGQRIVSEQYINLAASKLIKVNSDTYYGLSIWSKPSTSFFYGNGMLGQMMMVDQANGEVITYLSNERSEKAYLLEKSLLDDMC